MKSMVASALATSKQLGKGKAKENTLYGIPVDLQEALVLEDLLFVLMVCAPLPPIVFFAEDVGASLCQSEQLHVPLVDCAEGGMTPL